MSYEIRVTAQPRRPTAAAAMITTGQEHPGQWRGLVSGVPS